MSARNWAVIGLVQLLLIIAKPGNAKIIFTKPIMPTRAVRDQEEQALNRFLLCAENDYSERFLH